MFCLISKKESTEIIIKFEDFLAYKAKLIHVSLKIKFLIAQRGNFSCVTEKELS